MALLPIRIFPDEVLREHARPVENITQEIIQLLDDMAETMYAAPGIGLAANQVGELYRLFIVDIAAEDEPSDLREFINPEITYREGSIVYKEGCLSFPGIFEEVERAERIHVRAVDRNGKPFELDAEGLLAVAIQHENEHLDGGLIIDHVGPVERRMVRRKLQKRAARSEARR